MFTKKHYINVISLCILSIVTFINGYKLASHFTQLPALFSLLYILIFLSFFFIIDKTKLSPLKKVLPTILSLYVLLPYLLLTYFTSKTNFEGRLIETTELIFAVIFGALIILANKYINPKKYNFNFFLFAFLFGIILTVNFHFCVVLLIAVLYLLRESFPKIILFSILTVFFYFIGLNIFSEFIPQFNHNIYFPEISVWLTIIILSITVYAGWLISDLQELFFASGIMLFLYLTASSIPKIIQLGFYNAVNLDFSFSALLIVVPFLMFSIKEYQVDKFLGKIYKEDL